MAAIILSHRRESFSVCVCVWSAGALLLSLWISVLHNVTWWSIIGLRELYGNFFLLLKVCLRLCC